ncbi:MAG: hypothetical protein ACOYEV_09560 [Candidatus Nanopelagicales bacterium]
MLQIDKVQQIDGVTIYGDDEKFNVFYPVPQQPRYRLDAQGRPSFSFFKYRTVVDHEDGRKGGGYLLFDVEFVVDPVILAGVQQKLADQVTAEANRRGISPVPGVVIGTITYTRGSTSLNYNTGLVDKQIPNGASPSLYGNNVCTFALELPPEGATFFEQAMQGQGGAVSVVYDLWFWAKLPAVQITASFFASAFYSFYQTIDTDWNLWAEDDYRETIREQMIQSEAMSLNFDWGGVTDPKVQAQLRDWATRSLEDAVERKMIKAVAPVPDDQRKAPDGIEDVTRDISNTQISSFSLNYVESQTVEWHHVPQGILTNITSLKDADGNPLKWSDYARTIDLNDPFFQTLRINATVNADFANLPVHSVEVKLVYKGRPMANLVAGEPDGEVVLNDVNDVAKFAAYVENNDWNYTYSYQVNYRGESRQFQSPEVTTNEGNLTIGVDDVGILAVDVAAGDINWSEVDRAAVLLTYEDSQNGVGRIEEQFALTQASPVARIQRVIFQPLRNNYQYQVTYSLKNGREMKGPKLEGRSRKLFVNDVFSNRRTVSVRGIGDFANKIQTVFVDLDWKETANSYEQTKSQALSGSSPFFDWTFPVIDDAAGKLTYKATTAFKDGRSEDLPVAEASTTTILLPPPVTAFLEVQIVPDLVDWSAVRLIRVSLSYSDPAHNVSEAKDLIFSTASHSLATWRVDLQDKAKDDYTATITYYLTSGLQKTVGPLPSRDRALILDPGQ